MAWRPVTLHQRSEGRRDALCLLLRDHAGQDVQDCVSLASGDEIPCFALTEPTAGSDAASLTSSGEVFRDDDGELYLRLNWKKRCTAKTLNVKSLSAWWRRTSALD